ncbi:MAG: T9SS type A sorting domain-containing protein [Bacteroidia bacterium]|nr:T9SS type A sorting domain-containing protein [Bacteroidia bacterium]
MKKLKAAILFIASAYWTQAQINTVEVGEASNAYTIISNRHNQVFANDRLNLVGWIHRQNVDNFGGTPTLVANGLMRYDFSTDGGNTWQIDYGPLNPLPYPAGNNSRGRYPQALIWTKGNSSNLNDLRLGWMAACTDGNGWGNYMWGVSRNITGFGVNGPNHQSPDATFSFLSNAQDQRVFTGGGLCMSEEGVLWQFDNTYTNQGESGFFNDSLVLFKGVYNEATHTVNWQKYRVFRPGPEVSGEGFAINSANMAFSPDGRWGWAVTAADLAANPAFPGERLYTPVFWRSSDYGQTWEGPIDVQLYRYKSVRDSLLTIFQDGTESDTTTGWPYPVDFDITVDKYGNPHLFTMLMNGATCDNGGPYCIVPGARKILIDLTTKDQGATWCPRYLADVNTWRGTLPGTQLTYGNHLNVARNEAGDRIFYSWLDDWDAAGPDQMAPQAYEMALRVDDDATTPPKSQTVQDQTFSGQIYYATMSTTVLSRPGGQYVLPTVFLKLRTTDVNPVRFFYIRDRIIRESDFVKPTIDVGITAFNVQENLCFASSVNPTVTLRNEGSVAAADSAKLYYSVNGGAYQLAGAYALNLTPGQTQNVNLPAIAVGAGTSVIDLLLEFPNDVSCRNNNAQATIINFGGASGEIFPSSLYPNNEARGCGSVTLNTGLPSLAASTTWFFDGTEQPQLAGQSIVTVSQADNVQQVRVEVANPNCNNQTLSQTLTIVINPLPEILVRDVEAKCENAPAITLTATNETGVSVSWSRFNPTTATYDQVGTQNAYNISQTGRYRVTVTKTATGCVASKDFQFINWSISLRPDSVPEVQCRRRLTSLYKMIEGNPNGTIYEWRLTGTWVDANGVTQTWTDNQIYDPVAQQWNLEPIINYQRGGQPVTVTYRVVARDPAGCGIQRTATRTVTVYDTLFFAHQSNVDSFPDADPNASGKQIRCGVDVTFIDKTTFNTNGPTSRTWTFTPTNAVVVKGQRGSAGVLGSDTIVVNFPCAGSSAPQGTVTLRVKSGETCYSFEHPFRFGICRTQACQGTSRSVILTDFDFDVYPNPSTGVFNVETSARTTDGVLRVFDIHGKAIQTEIYRSGSTRAEVNLQSKPAGLYILRMEWPDGAISKTLVKE